MTPLFSSVFEEFVFWVVFLSGMFVATLIEGRGARQSRSAQKRMADNGTYLVANFALLWSLAIAIILGYVRIGTLPGWFFYPGLATYVLGLAIASWAVRTLGRFYAPTVQALPDHKVVDTGPYRLIRHPVYAGGLLSVLGLGLALQSWAAMLVLLVGVGFGYANRIRVEERFLIAQLGDDYVKYSKRTKRIIPLVF